MAIVDREYLFAIDSFKKPVVAENEPAVGLRLLELLLMDPGSNPLHPDMGVGIRNYRYGINTIADLETRISDQIRTYLPMYPLERIALIPTPDKILNIEIEVAGNIYRFDSGSTEHPISLADLENY